MTPYAWPDEGFGNFPLPFPRNADRCNRYARSQDRPVDSGHCTKDHSRTLPSVVEESRLSSFQGNNQGLSNSGHSRPLADAFLNSHADGALQAQTFCMASLGTLRARTMGCEVSFENDRTGATGAFGSVGIHGSAATD